MALQGPGQGAPGDSMRRDGDPVVTRRPTRRSTWASFVDPAEGRGASRPNFRANMIPPANPALRVAGAVRGAVPGVPMIWDGSAV